MLARAGFVRGVPSVDFPRSSCLKEPIKDEAELSPWLGKGDGESNDILYDAVTFSNSKYSVVLFLYPFTNDEVKRFEQREINFHHGLHHPQVARARSTCTTAVTAPRIVPIHVGMCSNDRHASQPAQKSIANRLLLRIFISAC